MVSALVIGGFVNIYLLRVFREKSEAKYYKIWIASLHSKLLLTLLIFTPLSEMVMSKRSANLLRAVTTLVFVFASSFLKNLREEAVSSIVSP